MIWPDHFDEIGVLNSSAGIPPDGVSRIGPFVWTPHIVDHECLAAMVSTDSDHAIADIFDGQLDHSILVRYDNNVGQRNVSPQNAVPGGKAKASIRLTGDLLASTNSLRVDATAFPADTAFEIRVQKSIADAATLEGLSIQKSNSQWCTLTFSQQLVGALTGFLLAPAQNSILTASIDVSYSAMHMQTYCFDLVQERNGIAVSRYSIEITAVKDSEDFIYGNRHSKELHVLHCPYHRAMNPRNSVPFPTVQDGLRRGYNGCAFCLPAHDTGKS